MAPKPPYARRAPAEPWRASMTVEMGASPWPPNPPNARRAPAKPWRASMTVEMGGPEMAPNPSLGAPRRSRGGPRSSSQGIIGCAMHPWHDVELGDHVERHFRAIIEIPKGSKVKYELDKRTGLLWLDRVLHSAVHYPANYGFLPQPFCEDGDALDVLVLGQEPVVPLCILRARAIGVMTMRDEKGEDDKIIAIHVDDPEYAHYTDISELPPHRLREV